MESAAADGCFVTAMNLLNQLRSLFEPVLAELIPDPAKVREYLSMIKPAASAEHGDYQANFAMPLAKVLAKKPHDVARDLLGMLPANDLIEPPTVAGPGFINLRLKTDFLVQAVQQLAADPNLGIQPAAQPKTFVIDYSSPNVAKPLHVGHLRSTIIGDAITRILRRLGHTVITDNHLGDWGAQFGMLIHGYRNSLDEAAYQANPVRELARLYLHVRGLFKKADDEEEGVADDPVKKACQEETARLHRGDPDNVALWNQFMPHCLAEIHAIYDRLGILPFDFEHGESFYNPMLPGIVDEMLEEGLAKESQGAIVFPNAGGKIPTLDEMKKEDPPGLLRKRDGAFTYHTSDLATIRYRVEHFHPDASLYAVDFRQALHFKTLFAQARRWGYDRIELTHISFGSVLGEDKKPFAARKGGAPELRELIDEAVQRGLEEYRKSYESRKASGHKVPDLTDQEQLQIAEVVGIGAMKYADLSQNRTSDYIFSYDKMLATEGNTAAYMQYAFARCCSILREAGESPTRSVSEGGAKPLLTLRAPDWTHAERNLALQLLRFPEALEAAAAEYHPHMITGYLWDLAKAASVFYENCPVLKAATPELRESRLLLVDLVGRVIQQALDLLGIRTVERM
jgi:arginyl-tRNA synthetase